MNEILTSKEAAKWLRISVPTLSKYTRQKRIKVLRFNTRGDKRYKLSDLKDFINGL